MISTGFDACFSAASGHFVLLAAVAAGTAVTAESPVVSTTIARPEPAQRFHDRMSAPPSITPAAAHSMADRDARRGVRRRCGSCSRRWRRWRCSPPPRSPTSGRRPRGTCCSRRRGRPGAPRCSPITDPDGGDGVRTAEQLVVGDLEPGVLRPVVLHLGAVGRRLADREVAGADRPGGHVLGSVEELQELPRRRLLRRRGLVHHEQLATLHEHAAPDLAGARPRHGRDPKLDVRVVAGAEDRVDGARARRWCRWPSRASRCGSRAGRRRLPVPMSALVAARPSFTMPVHPAEDLRGRSASRTPPSWRAPCARCRCSRTGGSPIAVHCSRKIGSVLSPSGAGTPLALSFSAAARTLVEGRRRLLGIEAGRA